MIRFLLGWCVYKWHHLKGCDTEALMFNGSYNRLTCRSCGLRIWQMPGLFSKR